MLNQLKELREAGNEEGFTLIELMIVVVIIGILAAIAIPIFANQQKSAIVSGVKSDVKNTTTNVATALVKAPTAQVIEGYASGDNGTGYIAATGTAVTTAPSAAVSTPTGASEFAVVASDSNSEIAVFGAWDGYTVVGTNDAVDAGFSTTYTSDNGKTVTVGD